MKIRIFTEPQQGATYTTLMTVAKRSEQLGFDAFFVSDHYLRVGSGTGLPGPTDAWTTLAGLARDTERLRLGTLVTSVTYRNPGILAIQVAQVDQMSGGRAELGLGAGWYAAEHAAYGIPFPEKRFGMLEEQLQVITGLWDTPVGATFSHRGDRYELRDSPALPKPIQPRPHLIIGGGGPTKTPRLAALYAAEFNSAFPEPETVRARFERVRAACERIDRDPDQLIYSVAMTVSVGRTDTEARGRASAIGRDLQEMQRSALGGTVQQVVDRIGALESAGASRVYLQVLDLEDADQLDLIAEEILPRV